MLTKLKLWVLLIISITSISIVIMIITVSPTQIGRIRFLEYIWFPLSNSSLFLLKFILFLNKFEDSTLILQFVQHCSVTKNPSPRDTKPILSYVKNVCVSLTSQSSYITAQL